jgi:hypothetical protein
MSKGKKATAKGAGLRRGEREAHFAKVGKATPFGMACLMGGVTVARGVEFEPIRRGRKRLRR